MLFKYAGRPADTRRSRKNSHGDGAKQTRVDTGWRRHIEAGLGTMQSRAAGFLSLEQGRRENPKAVKRRCIMHITCHECDTVFNLDERLLKPGGSKVRCSQCGNIFTAQPPAPMPEPEPLLEPEPETPESAPPSSPSFMTEETADAEAAADQELDGINLAELDAILDSEPAVDHTDIQVNEEAGAAQGVEDLDDADDDADLDLDFDMDIEPETVGEAEADAETAEAGDLLDDLDLDMDFELDDGLDLETPAEDVEPQAVADASAPEEPHHGEEPAEEDLDLALDDFDLDNVEDDREADAPPEPAADDKEMDLSLDDLDLDLEEGNGEKGAAAQDSDELELEELSVDDLELNEETGPEDSVDDQAIEEIDSLDIEDLDLDAVIEDDDRAEDEELALAPDEEPEQAPGAAPAAVEDADDLELDSLDLDDLDLDGLAGEAEATPAGDEEVVEEELSLEEAPLDEAPAAEEESELHLDEMDLDDEGSGDTLAANFSDEAPAHGGVEELDLEGKADEAPSDDLDLSDLSSLLEEPVEEAPAEERDDLDLELSLDDGQTAQEESASDDQELEELEFELDAEVEDKPIAKSAEMEPAIEIEAEKDDEELDLSDIEQMLEGDTILEGASPADEASVAGEPESAAANLADELDLSEIEEAIDSADGEAGALGPEGEEDLDLDLDISGGEKEPEEAASLDELDLDLEMDDSPKQSDEAGEALDLDIDLESDSGLELEIDAHDMEPQGEEELDLSDLDNLVVAEKPGAKSDTIDTGDIELEFEVEEQAEVVDYEPGKSQTFEAGADLPIEETIVNAPPAAKTAPKPRPKKQKKGTSKLLVVVLILLMLGGGGYYAYDLYLKDYLEKNNIQIPYLSQYLNPKPKDPAGIANLSVLDINSKFLESNEGGRLFVISGKIRNGYRTNRGDILLAGKLFSKGKVLVKSEQAYAGTIIPDQELKSLPITEIKKRLKKMPGPRDAAAVVKPGQTLPFIIVFSDLPDDLDEFVVEKVSSKQVP